MTPQPFSPDEFRHKGAIEQDRPEQATNTSMQGQMGHRDKPEAVDTFGTDFPEPGENVEHTGELVAKSQDRDKDDQQQQETNPEAEEQDMDPGQRQKQNQNDIEEDPLAA
jgi:hypothetical protein